MVLVQELTPQQRAGGAHEFRFENKPSPVLSYTEELELGPDLVHYEHERRQENWNKSPDIENVFHKIRKRKL